MDNTITNLTVKGKEWQKRYLPVVPSSVINFSPLHYRLYYH